MGALIKYGDFELTQGMEDGLSIGKRLSLSRFSTFHQFWILPMELGLAGKWFPSQNIRYPQQKIMKKGRVNWNRSESYIEVV
jgi:hypothetical protein